MAYVTSCQWDVFISYAWKNDTKFYLGDVTKRWVTEFQQQLTQKLSERLSESGEPLFFKDTQAIPLNHDFKQTLAAGLKESAVLVALMSTRYRTSEWCQWELQQFAELHGVAGENLAETGRVFVVNLENIHPDLWKPNLDRWLGKVTPLNFYSTDPTFGTVDKLAVTSPEFSPTMTRLAENIARQLDRMRSSGTSSPQGPRPPDSPATNSTLEKEGVPGKLAFCTVTLGAVTAGDEGPLNELERRLLSDGVRVLRAREVEVDEAEEQTRFAALLRQSQLFVQLIGPQPTARSEHFPQGLAWAQREEARRVLGASRVMQWRSASLLPEQVTDPDHRLLVSQAEYFGSLVDFAREVRRRASDARAWSDLEKGSDATANSEQTPEAGEPVPSTGGATPRAVEETKEADCRKIVLIKVVEDDKLLSDALRGHLRNLRSIRINPFVARNGLPAKRFVESRRQDCVAVLVVQGDCKAEWLQDRSQELLEVDFDLKDEAPVQAFYVRDRDAPVFYESDSVLRIVHGDQADLHRLLAAIEQRGVGP